MNVNDVPMLVKALLVGVALMWPVIGFLLAVLGAKVLLQWALRTKEQLRLLTEIRDALVAAAPPSAPAAPTL